LTEKLDFKISDAERLEFNDEQFDVVICECALCTFPDSKTAVNEMIRVLKPGGKVGITDMTIKNELPDNLKNILFQVVCISGAKQAEGYKQLLENTGFSEILFEDHSYTLNEILDKVDKVIQGWEFIDKLSCCDLEKILGITLSSEKARELLDQGYKELENGNIGYGLFLGQRQD
jgi:ubiquinone/menaquinone biosynthesis C-methylase UbiE